MGLFSKRKTVLLLDDEVELVSLMRRLLEDEGYKVIAFHNPLEALDQDTELKKADLMVLDVLMPNLNGYRFLQDARKLGLRKVPVIVVSALKEAADKLEAYDQGADYHLAKPFDIADFIKAVKYFLGDLSKDEAAEFEK